MTTPTDISAELKPCPFCGGQGKLETDHYTDDEDMDVFQYSVNCRQCDLYFVPAETQQAAIALWNTRAADAQNADLRREIDAQAEALRQRDVLLERAREGMLKAKMHRYDPARVYQTLKETLAALETKQVEG